MYTEDLALNNLKWLICHKTKQNYSHKITKFCGTLSIFAFI